MNPSLTRIKLFPKRQVTVLEQLEDKGMQIPYQCRSGYCGACRVNLIAGRVDYTDEPLAFCGPNEVLACSCYVSVDATLELTSFIPHHHASKKQGVRPDTTTNLGRACQNQASSR